jgi:hypothetical protein
VTYNTSLQLLPFPLRFPLAFDGKLLGQVLRIFTDTVASNYRKRQADRGIPCPPWVCPPGRPDSFPHDRLPLNLWLPTEAQWEYAAAHGQEARRFPWGSAEPTIELAIWGCDWTHDSSCGFNDIAPVGSAPGGSGYWGHVDLAGNLREWMVDAYGEFPSTCADCANIAVDANADHALRGGSYIDSAWALENSARTYTKAPLVQNVTDTIGFRCARPVM